MSQLLSGKTTIAALFSASALLFSAGCGSGASGVQTPTPLTPQSGLTVTYTPAGCGYALTTPSVDSAEIGGKVADTAAPDHVHASFASDPSSSFAVNWRSESSATLTQMFYGTDKTKVAAATAATADVERQEGHTLSYASVLDSDGPTRIHEVHVCGLKPATTYFYKVGNPGAFSTVYSLVTAPAVGASTALRFAVSGDSRDSMSIMAKVQKAIADSGATFQLFTGDAVFTGGLQSLWNSFFETSFGGMTISDVMATVPMMMENGNHENLSINYLAQFAIPDISQAVKSEPKQWYSFDYGNIHFVALNDTTSSASTVTGTEAAWLDADLAKVDRAKTPWIFVFHHKPIYSCAPTHGSDMGARAAWQPIYDKYKVDVVFNGHEHNYERTKPIRGFKPGTQDGAVAQTTGNDAPVNGSGTIYFVGGGAGAGLYDVGSGSGCDTRSKAEMINNYLIVDVQGSHLKLTAYRVNDGSVIEEIDTTKG
jgi:hypothetical protein